MPRKGHEIERHFSKEELSRKYDSLAAQYAATELVHELLCVRKLRRRLIRRARGEVLDLAVGTGQNIRFYPRTCRITAVDLSTRMLELARRRTRFRALDLSFLRMDGERLAFPDNSFDTIVDSLALCTFPDPVAVLREMCRVCRPGGSLLLLEHGRSCWDWLGRWQDRAADRHARRLGCRWNRIPLRLARQAGLKLISARHAFFGVFLALEAKPAVMASNRNSIQGGES